MLQMKHLFDNIFENCLKKMPIRESMLMFGRAYYLYIIIFQKLEREYTFGDRYSLIILLV